MGITVGKFLDIVSDYKMETVAGEDGLDNITEWFHFAAPYPYTYPPSRSQS